MNIEALKAFVKTAETGSFSATGRMLGKSQAAISKLIANLEIDLNGELFDRSGKYPTLTNLGMAIYERCQFLIEQETAIMQMANIFTQGQETELKFGIDGAAKCDRLDQIIAALIIEFEHVVIDICEAPGPILITQLMQNKLDLVLVPQMLQRLDGVKVITSYPIEFVAVVQNGHPLSLLAQVALEDLKPFTAVSFGQVREIIDQSFRTSLRHCYVNDPRQLASLVAQTNSFGFIPKPLAPLLCGSYQLEQLKLAANIANSPWQFELIANEAYLPQVVGKRLIELINAP